jgi:hypothetical protein
VKSFLHTIFMHDRSGRDVARSECSTSLWTTSTSMETLLILHSYFSAHGMISEVGTQSEHLWTTMRSMKGGAVKSRPTNGERDEASM